VVEAVRHARQVLGEFAADEYARGRADDLFEGDRRALRAVKETAALGHLPVVNFAAGGVATPADAALMMQLGGRRVRRLRHLQERRPGPARQGDRRGVTHYTDRRSWRAVSRNLGERWSASA